MKIPSCKCKVPQATTAFINVLDDVLTFQTRSMSGKFQATMPPTTPQDVHSFISVSKSYRREEG